LGSNINMSVASNVVTFNTLGRYTMTYLATSTTVTNTGNWAFGAGITGVATTGSTLAAGTGVFIAGNAAATFSTQFNFDVISLTAATVTAGLTIVSGLLWDLIISQVPSGLAVKPSLVDTNSEVHELRSEVADMMKLVLSLQKTIISEPSTPLTHVEDDLSNSVHIPRSALSALFGASSSSSRR